MYKYRLTRRGKIVVVLFGCIVFTVIGIFSRNLFFVNSIPAHNIGYAVAEPENSEPVDNIKEPPSSSIKNPDTLVIAPEELSTPAYADQKVIFITFDDGPSVEITPQILQTLDEYQIKATFFVLGVYAEKYPDLLQEIYNRGHAIGLHSYSHRYDILYSNLDSFKNDFVLCEGIVEQILGDRFKTRLFRFPGGSFTVSDSRYKEFVEQYGYTSIDWNTINGDAESVNWSPEQLFNRAVSTSHGRNHLILLMHDSTWKQPTADALPRIIEFFQSQGYEFAIFK